MDLLINLFTLSETVVEFSILGLTLGIGYQIYWGKKVILFHDISQDIVRYLSCIILVFILCDRINELNLKPYRTKCYKL